MRVLLISPPNLNAIRAEIPEEIDDEIGAIPSLGLMYLAQALINRTQHEVKVLDTRINRLSLDEYIHQIRDFKPDVAGITAMSFSMLDVIDTIGIINKHLPDTKVCIGGPHATYYPEETLNLNNVRVDYVVKGEGEEVFIKLLDALEGGKPLGAIEGIGWKDGDVAKLNPGEGKIDDLDTIDHPDRRLIDYKKCYSILGDGELMTTIQSSRGCPFRCIYCDEARSKFRRRSVDSVIKELKECVALGIIDYFFVDDLFTVNKKWLREFCEKIETEGIKIKFKISARVNTVDKEVINLLKKAGCYRIHYGMESGCQRVLDVLQKDITIEQQRNAIKWTKEAGIRSLCYFIIGIPTETREEMLQTIDHAIKLDPDYAHFSIATPYPKTQMYQDALDQGVFKEDFWLDFAKHPRKDFVPDLWATMDRGELESLQKYANKKFYRRPKVFIRELLNTRSLTQLFRKAKVGLKLLFPKRSA